MACVSSVNRPCWALIGTLGKSGAILVIHSLSGTLFVTSVPTTLYAVQTSPFTLDNTPTPTTHDKRRPICCHPLLTRKFLIPHLAAKATFDSSCPQQQHHAWSLWSQCKCSRQWSSGDDGYASSSVAATQRTPPAPEAAAAAELYTQTKPGADGRRSSNSSCSGRARRGTQQLPWPHQLWLAPCSCCC